MMIIKIMVMTTMLQVLAARLMQAIVPSLENTKDSAAAEELVSRLFKALGTALMTCRNDPTLMYSGVYSTYVVTFFTLIIAANARA